MEEYLKLRGDVDITVSRPFRVFGGAVIQHRIRAIHLRNLIVNPGKQLVAQLLGGGSSSHITVIACGTSNTAAAVSQTSLVAQQFYKTATITYPATNSVKFAMTMASAEGGTYTYQEIGLFTANGGTMLSRAVIGALAKSTLYTLQIEWIISVQ
jgi:hypothetical protein